MNAAPERRYSGQRFSMPIMLFLAMSGGVLLLVFLVSSYLLFINLSTKSIHEITDQVLTQSAKTAQQVFDEKLTSAFINLQSIGLSHEMVIAAGAQDKQAISEALQNIYSQGVTGGDTIYSILLYYSPEDNILIDESYSTVELDPQLVNVLFTTIDLVQNKQSISFLEYGGQAYIAMAVKIPVRDGRIYAALKLSDNSGLAKSIRLQTKSDCVSIQNGNTIIMTSGEQDFCGSYFEQIKESNYLLKTVRNGVGIIRYGLSHLDSFSDFDMGLVIPLDSVSRFEKVLLNGVYMTLLWVSGILIMLVLIGSLLISTVVKRLTSHATAITSGGGSDILPRPRSYIWEFEVIANTFNDLLESRSQALAAESANKAKGQLLANISHEIRTPINSIMNYARIMQIPGDQSNHPRFLNNIFQSSEFLLHLVNDLLDFSRIEAGYLAIENTGFELDSILRQLRDNLGSKAHKKQIELILDVNFLDEGKLVGDPVRLNQVLVNLCDNAIKFTRQGYVVLRIRLVKKQVDRIWLLFEVEDTGIGLREENQQKIFEVFTQEDGSVSRNFGGTGLGLPIVKRLVGLMGGEIKVESQPGKGSRFYFELSFEVLKADSLLLNNLEILKNITAMVSVRNEPARRVMSSMLATLGIRYVLLNDESAVRACFSSNTPCNIFIIDWQDEQQTDFLWLSLSYDINPVRPRHRSIILSELGWVQPAAMDFLVDRVVSKPMTLSELHDTLMGLYGENVKQEFSRLLKPSDNLLNLFKGKHVLVVDDNLTNQEISCILLEHVGFKTDVADSGSSCLKKVRFNVYDLILMDVQMPDMDGLEATRNLRQRQSCQQLPIIGLSAHAMENDRLNCLDAGMDDYLTKPIDPEKLYACLKKNLYQSTEVLSPKNDPGSVSGAMDALPVELPGIDVAAGLAKLHNLQSAYRRVLISYHKTHRNDVGKFRQALAADKWGDIRDIAHKLAGSSSSIGTITLGELCMTLESSCLDGQDEAGLTRQVTTVIAELEKVLDGLSSLAVLSQ